VKALLLSVALLVALAEPASSQRGQIAPEAASGFTAKSLVRARRHMVVAANPYASVAGRDILRRGGSAVDAAIVVQLVLNLVEPQSSGIGGGAFLLHYSASERKVEAYDGRETAPAAAKPDRFLKDGRPMPFGQAVNSGLSVGAPGTLAMLELAHRRHGRLPWKELFEPAIRLASDGFLVSPRLSSLLSRQGVDSFAPSARRYFFDATGTAWPPDHHLFNPEFAATLRTIAARGSTAFYSGAIAEAIVRAVAEAPNHEGDLTLDDLAAYRAKEREPVCIDYRAHRVCGMGPPSSGGIAVAQALKLLEGFDLGRGPSAAMRPRALHLIAEAEKRAYADRDRYVADSDFVPVPDGLLDHSYIKARRDLIDPLVASRAYAGTPRGFDKTAFGRDDTYEPSGTSHISIVDGEGNAVAMTTTIESGFGSRLWAAGFLLNNELTDFSFRPTSAGGRPVANRVEPGKRPRSSMAPTLVFDPQGRLMAVLGSPGGSRIILYVLKTVVALVDWDMDPRAAVAIEHFGSRGQRIAFDEMNSGLHVIRRADDGMLEGGADPRREGVALGD
jgi:gamma-glutamyltranspeptidase/glutathione hydrolase